MLLFMSVKYSCNISFD